MRDSMNMILSLVEFKTHIKVNKPIELKREKEYDESIQTRDESIRIQLN